MFEISLRKSSKFLQHLLTMPVSDGEVTKKDMQKVGFK